MKSRLSTAAANRQDCKIYNRGISWHVNTKFFLRYSADKAETYCMSSGAKLLVLSQSRNGLEYDTRQPPRETCRTA